MATPGLYIDTNTLQVGIGTTRPKETFHVQGNLLSTGNITSQGTVTASNLSILGDFVTLNTITSNTEQMVIQNAGTGPALKVTQTGANSIAEFYDDGNALALKIADGGNVGIGTANPQAKLHIQTSIFCGKSIKIGENFIVDAGVVTAVNTQKREREIASFVLNEVHWSTTTGFMVEANCYYFDSGHVQYYLRVGHQKASIHKATTRGFLGNTFGMRLVNEGQVGTYSGSPSNRWRLYAQANDYTLWKISITSTGYDRIVHEDTTELGVLTVRNDTPHIDVSTLINNNDFTTFEGNVGIGTTNPRAKLHIEGSYIARSQPSFRAYRSGSSITISSAGTIPYNATDHNIGDHYSTTTFKFTVPITGVYFFSASSYVNASVNSMFDLIYDGVLYERAEWNFNASQNSINRLSNIVFCVAGKQVWIEFAAGNVLLIPGTRYIHFCGHLLS